jgi:hypothetical protein
MSRKRRRVKNRSDAIPSRVAVKNTKPGNAAEATKKGFLRSELIAPLILIAFGAVLLTWSSSKLIEIFSENEEKQSSFFEIIRSQSCQTPSLVMLTMTLDSAAAKAFIHPSFAETSAEPPCIVLVADKPFQIIENGDRGPGSADLSNLPNIEHIQRGNDEYWTATVPFIPPPKPDANGFQKIPRNVALQVILGQKVTHPTYTTARFDMGVKVDFPTPKMQLMIGEKLEFKALDSPTSDYDTKHKNVSIQLNRGMSIFHLFMDDLQRQKWKDIYLLLAGGLLMLALGCFVDAAIKILDLIFERKKGTPTA